jgi:hypothetical protein
MWPAGLWSGWPPSWRAVRALRQRGVRFDGVGHQVLFQVVADVEGLETDGQVADDRVVEVLGPGGVFADVVVGPPSAKLGAADRQLTDQLVELSILGVAAGGAAPLSHFLRQLDSWLHSPQTIARAG